MRPLLALVLTASFFLLGRPASAVTYEVRSGQDLWARLRTLAAGDEVIVHAGTYAQGSRFEATWSGTAALPIVIRGAVGEARPVLTRGDATQDLMILHGSYFTLRGLDLVGGWRGVRLIGVDHAVLDGLVVRGTDAQAITCNGAGMGCSSLTIRGSEIHHTADGDGIYLGCNAAACAVTDSVIERNYLHDIGGAAGFGIGLRVGSYGNVVRDNVLVGLSLPGISTQSFDPAAGRSPNVIERNLVIGGLDDGILVVGRSVVRNNVVVGAGGHGIAVTSFMALTPTEVQVLHNTVVGASGQCFRAGSWSGGTGLVVANNAFYCEGGVAARFGDANTAALVGNLVRGTVEGASVGFTVGAGVAADLGAETALGRVYPTATSRLLNAASLTATVVDDFDLRPRGASPDVGAYERNASGAPAWIATAGFKRVEDPPAPVVDGGVDAGSATDVGFDTGTDVGTAIDVGFDAGAPPVDVGVDAGAPPVDVGVDAGAPLVDVGVDAGAPPVDVGVDAGAPPVDVAADATTVSDTFSPAVDGGASADAAVPAVDAGAPPVPRDAGASPDVVEADAGTDAGPSVTTDGGGASPSEGGCGCRVAPSRGPGVSVAFLFGVALLCSGRRRTRSRRVGAIP